MKIIPQNRMLLIERVKRGHFDSDSNEYKVLAVTPGSEKQEGYNIIVKPESVEITIDEGTNRFWVHEDNVIATKLEEDGPGQDDPAVSTS